MQEDAHLPNPLKMMMRERDKAIRLMQKVGAEMVAIGREVETTEDELVLQTLKARYANLESLSMKLRIIKRDRDYMIRQERQRLKLYF